MGGHALTIVLPAQGRISEFGTQKVWNKNATYLLICSSNWKERKIQKQKQAACMTLNCYSHNYFKYVL